MHTRSFASARAALAATLLFSPLGAVARPLAPRAVDTVAERAFAYVGASSADTAEGVAIGPTGLSYVVGVTSSDDFPTSPGAFQPTRPSAVANSGYVAAIDAAGEVVYATYLGGSGEEQSLEVAVDESGDVYVVGHTVSADFPLTPSAAYGDAPGADAFLAVLDPTCSRLLYATYLGGSDGDDWAGSVVASDGVAYVVGFTGSHDFPTTPGALRRGFSGIEAAFVAKVDTRLSGSASIAYATLFGADAATGARSVALGPDGVVYVVGSTGTPNLPVSATAYAPAISGGFDAFALALDPSKPGDEGLVYASYFGGETEDDGVGIGVHDGMIEIAGQTSSARLPTTSGAYRNGLLPGERTPAIDGFVAVLDPSKSGAAGLVYATYFGGTGEDGILDATVDAAGNVWVAGQTYSDDLPVTADAAGRNAPTVDGFVVEIAPKPVGAAGLVYASYFGGTSFDLFQGIRTDAAGRTVVAGNTASNDLPRGAGSVRDAPGGGLDGFVVSFQAPVTDLRLASSGFDPDPAPRGGLASVTLTATNAGAADARWAEVVYEVPAGATIASATDGAGVTIPVPPGAVGRVRIPLGTIPPGASASAALGLLLAPGADGTLVQSARAESSTVDVLPANDAVETTVRAVTYPELASAAVKQDPAFRVVLRGTDFAPGVAVYLGDDAAPWPTLKLKGTTKIVLKGRGLKDRFPKNVAVSIRVVNANGGSATGSLTR